MEAKLPGHSLSYLRSDFGCHERRAPFVHVRLSFPAITGDGAAIFRHACWMDLEGIVSKRIGSRYVSGRTRAWLKTKNPDFQR
jgi:ATP-dependent DNA ligase